MTTPHRPKASDLFQQATPLFAKKVPSADAYPDVLSATVVVEEFGMTGLVAKRESDLPHSNEFVDCSNPACYGGGYQLGPLLAKLHREHQTEGTDSAPCRGYEGSPKGRRKYRECMHVFKATIRLEYQDPSHESQAQPNDPLGAP